MGKTSNLRRVYGKLRKEASSEMDKIGLENLKYPAHKHKSTHHQRLERWLGPDVVNNIAEQMKDWEGPPVAIANVPGLVYATRGDFVGPIDGGYFGNLTDFCVSRAKRIMRNVVRAGLDRNRMSAGFSSLSDLISEATTGGKKQDLFFQKTGVTGVVGNSNTLFRVGTIPAAGSSATTADAGEVPTSATTGALPFTDAASGDTAHFVNGWFISSVAQGTSLLVTDRIFAVNRNHNSATAQAITGTPTRYQTSTTAPGSFIYGNVTTALGATASNLTLTYVDQAGNTAEAGAAVAMRVSSAVNTSPFTGPAWRYVLNTGDTGVRSLTNFSLSAAMLAGAADWSINHPICILPGINLAYTPSFLDGVNSSFSLERIYDGACLEIIELLKSTTTATTYNGQITIVSG